MRTKDSSSTPAAKRALADPAGSLRLKCLRAALDRIAHCKQDCSDKDAVYFMRGIAQLALETDDERAENVEDRHE